MSVCLLKVSSTFVLLYLNSEGCERVFFSFFFLDVKIVSDIERLECGEREKPGSSFRDSELLAITGIPT